MGAEGDSQPKLRRAPPVPSGCARDNGAVTFVIEHDSALTAWGQVHRDLRRRLDAGEWAAGALIPTALELIEQYGVSRSTVRRATQELMHEGYLVSRQGSGTFVTERADVRCELDLSLPWRKQITGHRAVSRLIETSADAPLPAELAALGGFTGPALFGRHVQLVDDAPIAVTESWYVEGSADADAVVTEHGFIEVGFATAAQAELLHSFLDIPLIVVVTRGALATGATVELSRTSWLGSRVRLRHGREVLLGELDMTELVRS